MIQFNVAQVKYNSSQTSIRPPGFDKVVYMLVTHSGEFNEVHGG